jgi:hypothetical protein
MNTVNAFLGDRARTDNMSAHTSDRLLRRQPTGAAQATDEYGSDWCLGCHEGRSSGGFVHNHPVESSATAAGSPYTVNNLPAVVWPYDVVFPDDIPDPTRETELSYLTQLAYINFGPDAGSAAVFQYGFLMPYPRSALQDGHYPICQQCHEDSRQVGSLDATGLASPEVGHIDRLGIFPDPENPAFQSFPHETENPRMVVETDDDLCLNCHPTGGIP